MAMNLGTITPKLFFVASGYNDFAALNGKTTANAVYENGFDINGAWVSTYATAPREEQYLDLGIVLDEREEVSMGGIPFSLSGTGVQDRVYWAVGGKVLRLTISGIIPDGVYTPVYDSVNLGYKSDPTTWKSNASVFKYKLCKVIAYSSLFTSLDAATTPHAVRYRRKMLIESDETIPMWVLTNYSYNHISGTRNLQYTITLDLANNITNGLNNITTGIKPRQFGEVL